MGSRTLQIEKKKEFFLFFHLSVFIYGLVRDILVAAVKSVEAAKVLVLFLFVFFTLPFFSLTSIAPVLLVLCKDGGLVSNADLQLILFSFFFSFIVSTFICSLL